MLVAIVIWAALSLGSPASTGPTPVGEPVELPGGADGIGFDDLQYTASLRRVLVPGGRSGRLYVVDPRTRAVSWIEGFSSSAEFRGGHDEGVTSVAEGAGRLFATDRTALSLAVVDPTTGRIVARAGLSASPDYVRYVPPTHEIWVTEPGAERIEVFRLAAGAGPDAAPAASGTIAVPGGPESLVVDGTHGRAYTHLWKGTTIAIDLEKRSIIGRWKNLCEGSRGIALDEGKGFLFVGCSEGRAVVLDAAHDGRVLGDLQTEARGVDIVDYDRALHHLYLPGGKNGRLAILGVDSGGGLTSLGGSPSPAGGHCVVSDQSGHAFVCDPKGGRVVVFGDGFSPVAWR
jgi:hypothetical protein